MNEKEVDVREPGASRASVRLRPPPWLTLAALSLAALAAYWVLSRVPPENWFSYAILVGAALSAGAVLWSVVNLYTSTVRLDQDGIAAWSWRGWRRVAWTEVVRVVQRWPSGDVLVHTENDVVRIKLAGRLDAQALLAAIRARVPRGAYAVMPMDAVVLERHSPSLPAGASDPLPELERTGGYRSATHPGDASPSEREVVLLDSLRPREGWLPWLLLGPSFVLVLFFSGWAEARRLLHHASTAAYWRRVETMFGYRVRLLEDGFESLDGRWRYRAPRDERHVYWEERAPDGVSVSESHRVSSASKGWTRSRPLRRARPKLEGRCFWAGVPGWLGGSPTLQHPTAELRIEECPDGYRVARLDGDGRELGATRHAHHEGALLQAETEYGVAASDWLAMDEELPPFTGVESVRHDGDAAPTSTGGDFEPRPVPAALLEREPNIVALRWEDGAIRSLEEAEARFVEVDATASPVSHDLLDGADPSIVALRWEDGAVRSLEEAEARFVEVDVNQAVHDLGDDDGFVAPLRSISGDPDRSDG